MTKIFFEDRQQFIQQAFNEVAKIVSEHGFPCIESSTPAISTEQCLIHLAVVAHDWSYDFTLIDAYAETYKNSNAEIIEYFGE